MIKIICICGARPNFIKIAPLLKGFETTVDFDTLLVHTGQHYDNNMSRNFFYDLGIPEPDINLAVGSGSHAVQTANIMTEFEPVLLDYKPDYVLVVGDVNSTVACGLVAVKLGVKLIHIEAGQRSYDRSMPEEINRIVTDAMSDLLFVSEPSGVEQLKKEGIASEKIYFVGNIMIDTLLANREKAQDSKILERLNIMPEKYGVITLHRPGNVDDYARFDVILSAFEKILDKETLVFPVHPRTLKNLDQTTVFKRMKDNNNLIMTEPLGYLDFIYLMENAAVVMTDSGGIQEETTVLGVPCMTLRENTEWPITIQEGTNRLVPLTEEDISQTFFSIIHEGTHKNYGVPKYWDGKAAERIISVIQENSDRL